MVDIDRVRTRPVEPVDEGRLEHMWTRLSRETLYQRFHASVGGFPRSSVHQLVETEHREFDAVVALVDDEIVGFVRYQREHADPARAEFAILIEDDWQGGGLGGRLLEELMTLVRSRGVTTLTASLLMDNQRMLRLVRRHAPDALIRARDGEYEVTINLDPAAG